MKLCWSYIREGIDPTGHDGGDSRISDVDVHYPYLFVAGYVYYYDHYGDPPFDWVENTWYHWLKVFDLRDLDAPPMEWHSDTLVWVNQWPIGAGGG